MTGSPARIVGVAQLLLDVIEDLGNRPPSRLSTAETDFLALMVDHYGELDSILVAARAEMATLAPMVLAGS